MKKVIFIILILTNFSLRPQTVESTFSPFQEILSKHLIEKKLNGGGLVSAFEYKKTFTESKIQDLRGHQRENLKKINLNILTDKNKANAFWINAYNFFMIDYILTHKENDEIVSSVKDYGSFFNPYKVFKKKFINISGEIYGLSQIEKEILLGNEFKEKDWFDTKVHFAVNCASVGCPPLRKEIYTSQNIQKLLRVNTKMALKTPRHLSYKDGTLYLTKLFKWYQNDFNHESGTIINFIKKYGPEDLSQKINEETKIKYIKYDWSLNSPSNFNDI